MATPRVTSQHGIAIPHNPVLEALREEVTAGLAENANDRPPIRGIPVRGAGQGRKGRLTLDGTFIETETIIEQVREMLADSWTKGDIKRALVRKFGGSPKGFIKHIAYARKRNLQQLSRKPEEAKSDAMQQWQKLLVEAKADKRRTLQNLQSVQAELIALRKHLNENPPDDFLDAMARIDAKNHAVLLAEKAYNSARHWVDKYQNTIDGMLGNKAAEKRENVNSNQTTLDATIKAELANPKEPLTAKEGDEMIVGMVQKLKEQLTAKAKEEATAPNKN